MRSWYTPNWLIRIADQLLMQYFSIEMTAEQHMPLVWDQHLALQTYPPIVGPCAKMTLLSIASHISQAAVPLPIYFFVLGPGSSAHAELWDSQFKSWVQHHGLHSHMASGAEPGILDPVSQIQESRRVEDPEIFGSRMAVLAFTLFLNIS